MGHRHGQALGGQQRRQHLGRIGVVVDDQGVRHGSCGACAPELNRVETPGSRDRDRQETCKLRAGSARRGLPSGQYTGRGAWGSVERSSEPTTSRSRPACRIRGLALPVSAPSATCNASARMPASWSQSFSSGELRPSRMRGRTKRSVGTDASEFEHDGRRPEHADLTRCHFRLGQVSTVRVIDSKLATNEILARRRFGRGSPYHMLQPGDGVVRKPIPQRDAPAQQLPQVTMATASASSCLIVTTDRRAGAGLRVVISCRHRLSRSWSDGALERIARGTASGVPV